MVLLGTVASITGQSKFQYRTPTRLPPHIPAQTPRALGISSERIWGEEKLLGSTCKWFNTYSRAAGRVPRNPLRDMIDTGQRWAIWRLQTLAERGDLQRVLRVCNGNRWSRQGPPHPLFATEVCVCVCVCVRGGKSRR